MPNEWSIENKGWKATEYDHPFWPFHNCKDDAYVFFYPGISDTNRWKCSKCYTRLPDHIKLQVELLNGI